ncbi:MAG TPA: insulinase family protein [Paludibacteraceae bacterium]|nr:insulinase family protein [Paludibacteraceae bacterium]HQB68959.1 insulinase family protein [Paludibacteraceae bacterium]HRS67463.1 insulinase family protein [Paludibacteraceae bacterium]
MKTKIYALIIGLLTLVTSLFAQQDPSRGLTQYKLENGLTVLLWEDHNQPDVHGRIVTRAGALDEPANYTGLAHYLEHVLFKGTKNIGALDWEKEKPLYEEIIKLYDQLVATKDEKMRAELVKVINEKSMEAAQYGATDDFSNLTEGMGGEGLNAFTSYDLTAYFNNFPSFQMEKWLELNSERLMDPVFRSFQAELENVFEEYNMYQDDNNTHITEFLFDNLYKGHPYSRDVIGTSEHLKNPSLSALINFFETWYVPNNMALVLVGNFDTETVKPMIAEKFGRLKAKELPERPTYNPTTFEGNPKVSAKLGYYPQVVWGYNGVKKGDKDELLLDFTLSLLNNEHSTGLLDKLMLDGDIQMAVAYNDARRDLGRVLVMAVPYFDIAQNMYESNSATEKIIMKEVDKLKNGTFEDWLFESVKAQFLQSYKVMFERLSSKVEILTYAFAYNEPVDSYLKMNERVNAITREDIQRTAQKYLNGNHITVTIEKGTPKKNKLKKPDIKPLDPPKGVETAYAQKIKAMPIGNVEEKYNNFDDVKKVKLYKDVTLFSSENKVNDVFTLTLKYGVGTEKMPKLKYATALMNTAGALPDVEAQTLRRQFSELGASCSYGVTGSYFYIQLTGDEKNLAEICKLMTRQTLFPKLDNKQLEHIIGGELNSRMIEKKNPDMLSDALMEYVLYKDKSEYIDRIDVKDMFNVTVNPDGDVSVNYLLTIPELTKAIIDATSYELDIHFVGQTPVEQAAEILKANLPLKEGLTKSESPIIRDRVKYDKQTTIYFLPNKEVQQAKIYFYVNGQPYDIAEDVDYDAFNQYFSGGFSGLVMNEIREKRSMAYTAYGQMVTPPVTGKDTYLIGYVGTQGDKVADAVDVYMDLLTNMPLYPERLDNIKTYLRQSSLTNKPSFREASFVFDAWQKLGYTEDPAKINMPKIDDLKFEQISNFYNKYIKDQPIVVVITGDAKTINLKAIQAKWGKVTKLSPSRLFKGGF